jgi:hypothetical protein
MFHLLKIRNTLIRNNTLETKTCKNPCFFFFNHATAAHNLKVWDFSVFLSLEIRDFDYMLELNVWFDKCYNWVCLFGWKIWKIASFMLKVNEIFLCILFMYCFLLEKLNLLDSYIYTMKRPLIVLLVLDSIMVLYIWVVGVE